MPLSEERKKYLRDWQKKNKDKVRQYREKWLSKQPNNHESRRQRPYHLKKQYNITEEDYTRLLEKQNGRCAICYTDTPTGKWKVFAVDHCHKTGKVRGLLCNECNRGMGLLGDDVQNLMSAVAYLEKNNSN